MAAGVLNRAIARGLDAWGHTKVSTFAYTGPNPYATGGEAQAAQAFKLGVLEDVIFEPAINAAGTLAVLFAYNYATGKIQAYWQTPTAGASGGLAEVDNGTDLSSFTSRGVALGKA